ncbi:hypothetical protein O1M63_50485 [Streptomyces mirabilis]|nr:hypothetical protein [Streptomyces mirabilis]
MGPAVRSDGRHRRWTPQDVAMLEEMCRLTSAGVPPAQAARTAQEGVGRNRPGPELPGEATGRAGIVRRRPARSAR